MKKRTIPIIPALPAGMVRVEKGMHEVFVGIINANRIPAMGFDVAGDAPHHWRMVDYGKFGIMLGAKVPLEVRVILDGELLTETKLMPYDPPAQTGMDPEVLAAMAEMPQPHWILRDAKNNPFVFTPHDSNLSPADIVAEQIHPGRFDHPQPIQSYDKGATEREELKVDVDLNEIARLLNPPKPAQPDNAVAGSEATAVAEEGDKLTQDDGTFKGWGAANSGEPAREEEAGIPPLLTDEEKAAIIAERAGAEPTAAESIPPVDTVKRSMSWAPSHGLVAVGVRIMQTAGEGEPPTAPDGYSYVLFQLNPWNLHMLARARLARRIAMPSQETMARLMEEEGLTDDLPAVPNVVCASCLKSGRHSH